MTSACLFVGHLFFKDGGTAITLGETKKNYWKCEGFMAVDEWDFPTQVMVYAGPESRPVEKGTYFVTARVILTPSMRADSDEPELVLYTNNVSTYHVYQNHTQTNCIATRTSIKRWSRSWRLHCNR